MSAEKIERGLTVQGRHELANEEHGWIDASAGAGRTLNGLRRRGLVGPRFVAGEDTYRWWIGRRMRWATKLTPLGVEVAKLAQSSTRPGGGESP